MEMRSFFIRRMSPQTMKILRLLLLPALLILIVSWLTATTQWKKAKALSFTLKKTEVPGRPNPEDLQLKALAARKFIRQKGYNSNYCFLIDMGLPSGQKRFFIYDLQKDSIRLAALVAHGNCFEYWLEGRRYSNVVGSGCTSLGKYKVGNAYTGKWGYSYKLHGLDSSNNNAFERTVVLHGHSCVPETEVSDDICQSNGCPTVNPAFLLELKRIINGSAKPLLLWIYD